MFDEPDKRKIQEDRKILARPVPAGERGRAHVGGVVCSGGAGVCLVGHAGILILGNELLKDRGILPQIDRLSIIGYG